ncbi:hypothetical protein COLO4_30234 [Corchorus olitorius]|uniref:Uncharacterized protein n=1 Tax=Corchorus olitorius TaxID=93759 RepID=A0A1R3H9T7_9ROSI|nr:hypothetical protein COLO4_30234 [Corchorus olitorius]
MKLEETEADLSVALHRLDNSDKLNITLMGKCDDLKRQTRSLKAHVAILMPNKFELFDHTYKQHIAMPDTREHNCDLTLP